MKVKLTKRKDGRWQFNMTIGESKKQKAFYSSEPDERKASKEILKKISKFNINAHNEKHNFGAISQMMLEEKEHEVGYKTLECYKTALIHLCDFESMDIEEITPSMLSRIFERMSKKGFSYSSIQKVKTTFGLVMNHAIVYNDLNITNFTREVKIPKRSRKTKIYAPDDIVIEKIIKNAESSYFGMWAMIQLMTGMRRGELAALQYKDINFQKSEINIWRSVEFVNNQAHLKDKPKSENSIRTVPIMQMLYHPLVKFTEGMDKDDFVFGKSKPLSETMIKKRWKKYCEDIGVEIHQHQLRHAYAKILYRAGIDPKTAQGLLGHANISITMDIYTDFSDDMTKKSILKIDKFMSNMIK